jgi:PBP1b-binding outer membrane lipoprotein LpoB
MTKLFISVFLLLLIIASCNKDKFNTKPALKFKSVNKTKFAKGDAVRFELEATDKEGDLVDSIFIYRVNRNCPMKDTTKLFNKMPPIPIVTNSAVTLLVDYSYPSGIYNGLTISTSCAPNRNDTCKFRFVLKDKAKNVSDTVESPELVFLK